MFRTSILLNNDKNNMIETTGCSKMIENSVIEDKNGTMELLQTPDIFLDCLKLHYSQH